MNSCRIPGLASKYVQPHVTYFFSLMHILNGTNHTRTNDSDQKAGTIRVKKLCQKVYFISKHVILGMRGGEEVLVKPEAFIVDLMWKWFVCEETLLSPTRWAGCFYLYNWL